jgi:hypothetical protein
MPTQFKKPQHISITVSNHLYEHLIQIADQQGRSLSNYASYVLESSLLGITDPGSGLGGGFPAAGINAQRTLQPAAMLHR